MTLTPEQQNALAEARVRSCLRRLQQLAEANPAASESGDDEFTLAFNRWLAVTKVVGFAGDERYGEPPTGGAGGVGPAPGS